MPIADMGAGDIGVKALHPMNQPMVQQKPKRPVDGNRCQSALRVAQASEDFVRANGHVACRDDVKDPASLRRQPKVAFGAEALHPGHHHLDAAAMVMVGRWKCNGIPLHSSSCPISDARRYCPPIVML